MLGLAAPAWLAALAALAVPIAIHLWTRRPARVVRVASIRHITGAPVHARRLRLDDPWLLLLRAALIAVVVAMLAQPYFAARAEEAPGTWVLVDPVLLQDADGTRIPPLGEDGTAIETAARLLDSLRLAGTPIRLLVPGLPQFSWSGPPPARVGPHPHLWSLLREAEHSAPPGTRFLVVAEPRLPSDAGERPRLTADVAWVAGWSASAERPAREARSDTLLRSALVLADDGRHEAGRYVAAAIEAAAGDRLRGGTVRLLPLDSAEAAAAGARAGDWLVWLADRPVPAVLMRALESGATVISDGADTTALAAAPPRAPAPELLLAPGLAPVEFRAAPIPGVPPDDTDAALWEAADGRAVLAARRVGEGLRLVYAGRFDAVGSDLVLQPAFPELVARLWAAGAAMQTASVPVTVGQITPARPSAAAAMRSTLEARARSRPRRDLTSLLWLAALALLLGERLLASRHRPPVGTA